MSYIYAKIDDLDESDLVGSHQCVALVQHYAKAPITSMWKEGAAVFGNKTIAKGTAIATFVGGKYPNHSHGNHAAFYVSQDATGIWVMDQWKSDEKLLVTKRHLHKRGKSADGKKFLFPIDNAQAYSIIE